jgi:hypothetical protein
MTTIERFKAVCHGEKPDYVPIFSFPGSPGMGGGCMEKTWRRLVEGGMPEYVDGCLSLKRPFVTEKWEEYWGTVLPIFVTEAPADPGQGFRQESRIEGEFEIIECESGAITRQVIDNDITYSMPDFIEFPVRDRKSWEFYRERMTPGDLWPDEKIEKMCEPYREREKPLAVHLGGTWGVVRSMMGPERACTILYDDPGLVEEIHEWMLWIARTYRFPLVEKLRPEIVSAFEDLSYNHGMLISPAHFERFCMPTYRAFGEIAEACNVDLAAIDSDGNVMELVPLAAAAGLNGMCPFEVKAGNDLFALREEFPEFVMVGWLEKEVINEGNEHMIEGEIMSKVPPLLEKGYYFPNGDHGIQPPATFDNLCRFMTLLHEVCENPEGEFPRV